jgi:hypothetical protein
VIGQGEEFAPSGMRREWRGVRRFSATLGAGLLRTCCGTELEIVRVICRRTPFRWGGGLEPARQVEDDSECGGDDATYDDTGDEELPVLPSVGPSHSGQQVIPVFFFITSREQHALTGLLWVPIRGWGLWQQFGLWGGSTKWMSELWLLACAADMAGRMTGYGFWRGGLRFF